MTVQFSVERWAAWAPGLCDQAAWLAWLEQPFPLLSQDEPSLLEMPPMLRRRIERLGRMALQVAYWGQGERDPCPIVFASRRGDIGRSLQLLRQLAAEEPLSPAAFSTSVHNAIGALYSIAKSHTGYYTAIAAGDETVEAAFVEALGLLVDGAPEVLLVYYDEPMPAPYDVFQEVPDFSRAMAYCLRLTDMGGYSLVPGPSLPEEPSQGEQFALPSDLATLRFLVAEGGHHYIHTVGSRRWEWSRHA